MPGTNSCLHCATFRLGAPDTLLQVAMISCWEANARENQETEPTESACDAVSEALKVYNIDLVYETVARIWSKGRSKTVNCQA